MDYTAAEKAIAELEAERDKINAVIEGFRATLAKVRNGTPLAVATPVVLRRKVQAPMAPAAPATGRGGGDVFRRKFDIPGDEAILRLLREVKRPLTKKEAHRLLVERHYEYRPGTVAYYLDTLTNEGEEVERVKAPRGSGCTYAFKWKEPKRSTEEVG
jgi:hypothetical protein